LTFELLIEVSKQGELMPNFVAILDFIMFCLFFNVVIIEQFDHRSTTFESRKIIETFFLFYRVECTYKCLAHLNFTMIFVNFFFQNNFTRMNHCNFIHHKSHITPLLSYLPCTVSREYFSIIFNVKKFTLCSIKYRNE
jgi:hypothetical protein